MEAQVVSSAKIVEWFTILHHTSSSPELRKQADN